MQRIHASLLSSYNGYLASHDKVDKDEALALIKIAEGLNENGGSGCCGFGKPSGDKALRGLIEGRDFKSHFDTESLMLINHWLRNGHRLPQAYTPPRDTGRVDRTTPTDPREAGFGKVILDWKCEKKTWNCHWWPMSPVQPGGDPYNNLYAPGGVLEKYDLASGRRSRETELATHVSNVPWHGHCNNAAMVAAVLREPVKDVTWKGQTFTPHEIKGLLCKVIASITNNEDMKGQRYDDARDDRGEPNPAFFMEEIIKPWCRAGQYPIILDVDPGEEVWNFPYDTVKIFESDKAPADIIALPPLGNGKIKYYRCEMKGTGFPDRERTYRYWIQYDNSGKATASQWLPMEDASDANINPDFAWRSRPLADLNDPGTWVTAEGVQDNGDVLAQDVFQIYKASI